MFIQIDMHSSVPIYKQLKTAIISSILSGKLKEGDRLPSVRQLGSDLGINLHTVNKAYNLLKDEGYIIIHRNQGAIISKPTKAGKEDLTEFANALLPIVIEIRARNITRTQFDELMDVIWEQDMIGGDNDEHR
ncbi:GntR family transcriptional regulator [Desulfosporosinus sp. Sb-LF]|uniref:GntR family transcriptional regulator n=1 Tax=Desulfosporosinus sp. Sb-LF TaxID=2560027 RepID=UPI00107F6F7D|nr:GntR family transcriptional regulator [Desulfosporosinus sp. Sb-LF]TGE31099.1 GntR family transcriptional regulator [Desulfosporosinus sp. Sb-LF]